ncbi:MAG: RNA 2',3'-cyclic phosphodiesterase [Fidelibacterota bacterium]
MPSERLLRTFLAVELPRRVKETALHLQTTVQAKPKVVKWLKAVNVHLTLRFIVPTPESDVPQINEAIAGLVGAHHDLSLSVVGTGVFPKKERPRVLWLGVDGEVEKLRDLVNDVNGSLAGLGYPAEERDYTPHVTIGRIRYPQKITPDVSNFLNCHYEPVPVEVKNVTFFHSDLVPGGPIYSVLGLHELTPLGRENS